MRKMSRGCVCCAPNRHYLLDTWPENGGLTGHYGPSCGPCKSRSICTTSQPPYRTGIDKTQDRKHFSPDVPLLFAVLHCCIAAALCAAKAREMDGTCSGSLISSGSRVAARSRSVRGLDLDHDSQHRCAVEGERVSIIFSQRLHTWSSSLQNNAHPTVAWAGVVPYRILLLSPSRAGHTADRCSKEIAKRILAWEGPKSLPDLASGQSKRPRRRQSKEQKGKSIPATQR